MDRLREVAPLELGECAATMALGGVQAVKGWPAAGAVLGAPPKEPRDERPCTWCGEEDRQGDMILCDYCNACYHR